jgi:hypothetical protein
VPAIVYVSLFNVIGTVAYPPPMYTLLVMLVASTVPGKTLQIAAAATFQVLVFALLNAYLLDRRIVARKLTIWIRSILFLALATLIQIPMAIEAWSRDDYPSARTSVLLGFVALAVATLIIVVGLRRSGTNAAQVALTVNCLIHCAVVAVLFPYVGELP